MVMRMKKFIYLMIVRKDAEAFFPNRHAVVVFFAALLGNVSETGSIQFLPFNGNIYYGILVFNLMLFWSLGHERRCGDFSSVMCVTSIRDVYFVRQKLIWPCLNSNWTETFT
jgi:hypothetical protein